MKNQLSEAQIALYQENGFLVIENFLDASELAHWQKVTQEAVDQRLAQTNPKLTNQQNPESY
jgi:phytanoyl-CoA hydroxylase